MILINSASYVIPEFRVEFGKIPPCLMPIGNKKLVELQVSSLKSNLLEPIYLTLPTSYSLSADEKDLFSSLNVTLIKVPDNLKLAESILYALNIAAYDSETLYLLHGDTLFDDFLCIPDSMLVSSHFQDYNWELEEIDQNIYAWCGFFSFSRRKEYIKSLAISQGDFIKSVKSYDESYPLKRLISEDWKDLGHVNTYFSSRSKLTTQRSFNSLNIDDGVVYKKGEPYFKIEAEYNWFNSIPPDLKKYSPQLIDFGYNLQGESYYCLEYLPNVPLNEVYVHGKNSLSYWDNVFNLIDVFLEKCRKSYTVGDVDDLRGLSSTLFKDKTWDRFVAFSNDNNINLECDVTVSGTRLPSLRIIVDTCIEHTSRLPIISSIMHGDLCFSNILYDSRASAIKVIDPRGLGYNNEISIYGDQKYDLAKLLHSIIGLYDYIIAGRYTVNKNSWYDCDIEFPIDDRVLRIQSNFMELNLVDNLKLTELIPATVLLFISMLPLHSDRPDRQFAMYTNALRLYAQYIHSP
ncbi:hypothetical protein [Cobetia crustatorum]|uniref:hypothetical protein n=1 Tax=Cobetia crustatorum TaxID=553385 RepID=UPI0004BB80B2|nr:hypothetical protein [Cobetia crustatorum]